MPVPTVPYQLSFSYLLPSLGGATQEEVMVRHPWLYIGLPGVRVKTQTVEYDNRADRWSANFLVNDGAVAPLSANFFAPSQTVEYDHREFLMTARQGPRDCREFLRTVGGPYFPRDMAFQSLINTYIMSSKVSV